MIKLIQFNYSIYVSNKNIHKIKSQIAFQILNTKISCRRFTTNYLRTAILYTFFKTQQIDNYTNERGPTLMWTDRNQSHDFIFDNWITFTYLNETSKFVLLLAKQQLIT